MLTHATCNLHAARCGGGAAEPQGVAAVEESVLKDLGLAETVRQR